MTRQATFSLICNCCGHTDTFQTFVDLPQRTVEAARKAPALLLQEMAQVRARGAQAGWTMRPANPVGSVLVLPDNGAPTVNHFAAPLAMEDFCPNCSRPTPTPSADPAPEPRNE